MKAARGMGRDCQKEGVIVADQSKGKTDRVLDIYMKLLNGNLIRKEEAAVNYNVNERSIQRDIEDIRSFLQNNAAGSGYADSLVYDWKRKGYCLEQIHKEKLSDSEILAVCKILLDSRAFTKKEMTEMIHKIISCCASESSQKEIAALLANEEYHYVEPRHKTVFMDTMWKIGQAIRQNQYIEIAYVRSKDRHRVKRKVKPVAIMFSEYYFYLTAFIEDEAVRKDFDVINDSFPTIYRMDRIKELRVLDERFHIPYANRFEEGEFRKRIQFMTGGKLQKVRFLYSGMDIDAILDRLPTAKILSEEGGKYVVEAEVFGKGIDMWLRSQGEAVKRL